MTSELRPAKKIDGLAFRIESLMSNSLNIFEVRMRMTKIGVSLRERPTAMGLTRQQRARLEVLC